MKKRNRFLSWLLIFVMMVSTFILPATEAQAVVLNGGYDTSDPKGFYNLMYQNGDTAIFQNNHIYFATRAKLASASSGTRYRSIGYTIDVTNGTHSLQIEIGKEEPSFTDVSTYVDYDNVSYDVNAISYTRIVELCKARYGANNSKVQSIFSSPYVGITCNAIIRVSVNGTEKGGLSDNNNGTVSTWGTVYRLVNSSDYSALKNWGFSNNFASFRNIQAEVPNAKLTVNYYADTKTISGYYGSVSSGTFTSSNAPTSTAATISSSSGVSYSIAANGKINGATTSGRQLESITIRTLNNLSLSKTGYYLKSGEEWKDDNGKVFVAGREYPTPDINWSVTATESSTNLYANWKPITYTLKYDGNGGTGSMNSETHTFDEAYFTPAGNTFTKRGYTFTGWR